MSAFQWVYLCLRIVLSSHVYRTMSNLPSISVYFHILWKPHFVEIHTEGACMCILHMHAPSVNHVHTRCTHPLSITYTLDLARSLDLSRSLDLLFERVCACPLIFCRTYTYPLSVSLSLARARAISHTQWISPSLEKLQESRRLRAPFLPSHFHRLWVLQ